MFDTLDLPAWPFGLSLEPILTLPGYRFCFDWAPLNLKKLVSADLLFWALWKSQDCDYCYCKSCNLSCPAVNYLAVTLLAANVVNFIIKPYNMWFLFVKVMEEYSLNSAKKLCITEKCWHQLASHFTVVLGERDTSELTTLQSITDQWRQQIDQFHLDLKDLEEEMRKQIQMVVNDIRNWHGVLAEKFRYTYICTHTYK